MPRSAILLYVCAACLHAASGVDLSDGLSAREAVALALERNPELLALRQGRIVLQAKVAETRILPDPEIRLGVSDVLLEDNAIDRRQNNLGLRWAPPRPARRALETGVARSRVEEASGSIAAAEQKLAAEVRLLHQTICLLDEQIKLAEENVRVRRQILEAVDSQVQAGVKNTLDRSMAELSLADALALPQRYRTERRVQFMRLVSKIGLPPGQTAEMRSDSDPLAFSAVPRDRAKFLAAALENRAELNTARERSKQAALAVDAGRRERYPWISYVQVTRRIKAGDPSSWGFQAGVDLPVFRWGGSSLKPAAAELEQSRLEEQAVKSAIAAEVDEALVRVEAAGEELKQVREVATASSRRNMEAAAAVLAAGQADLLEPLLAKIRELSAKQAFVEKLAELRTLEAGLDQAVGYVAR